MAKRAFLTGYGGQPPSQYNGPSQYGAPPQYNTAYNNQTQTNVVVAPGNVSMTTSVEIDDYMNRAIIATICCFWPVGIFAIMRSSECRSALSRGDIASAQEHSNSARQLSNIAIAVGGISVVVLIIVMGVYFGAIVSSYNSS